MEDVEAEMTDTCPLLGIPLKRYPLTQPVGRGRGGQRPDAYSLDRKDPTKGYIPGNIIVCSWRANSLKKDATPDELLLLATNFKRIHDAITHSTNNNETSD